MLLWDELLRQTVNKRSEGLGQNAYYSKSSHSMCLDLSVSPSTRIVANNSTSSLTMNVFSSPGNLMTQFLYEPKALLQFDIF